MQNAVTVDKNSREYLEGQYKSAWMTLIPVLALTVINIITFLAGSDSYWIFTAAIPYWLVGFGFVFDGGIVGTFTATALFMAGVILVVYLLCLIFARKYRGWLIAALVMFALDTLCLVGLALMLDIFFGSILDMVFHGYILFVLIRGVAASGKLKKLPPEMPMAPVAPFVPVAPVESQPEFQNWAQTEAQNEENAGPEL